MDIGIGLPNAVRGVDRRGVVEWARRAEQAGFSSLGTIDRLLYPSYEPLISLAAAAAVTERIRLVTDVLLAPLRANTALLAKQAASVHDISGGRLVLGLAVGGRPDDYELSALDFAARGRRFDQQLAELDRCWSELDRLAPSKSGDGRRPVVLIGGSTGRAYRRAAAHAEGWTMGGGTPEMFADGLAELRAAWGAAGRDGEPRTMALFYYGLGADAERMTRESLGDYYGFLGDYAQQIVQSAAKDEQTLKAYVSAFEAAGCDEVICFPTSPDPDQVDMLARAVLA